MEGTHKGHQIPLFPPCCQVNDQHPNTSSTFLFLFFFGAKKKPQTRQNLWPKPSEVASGALPRCRPGSVAGFLHTPALRARPCRIPAPATCGPCGWRWAKPVLAATGPLGRAQGGRGGVPIRGGPAAGETWVAQTGP